MPRLQRLTDLIALAGTGLLLAAAGVICLDVILRWLFAAPIPARADLEKMIIALALVTGFPAILLQDRGITVRAFGQAVGRLGARWRYLTRGFGIICSASFFGIASWQIFRYAANAAAAREMLPTLAVPIWPFWAAVGIGLGVAALAALCALGRMGEPPPDESKA